MRINTRFFTSIVCLLAGVIFFACNNPVGLGGRVNTEVPVINIPDDPDGVSNPGSYLEGDDNIIYLEVIQEFGIDSVMMSVEYLDLDGFKQIETLPAYWDAGKGCYAVNIETIKLNMADGTIKAWVTATDVSGKETITTDMIYVVKNTPPQIEMTLPRISGEAFDSPALNPADEEQLPVIMLGTDMMGIATDLYGIEKGYPQIMMWYDGYTGAMDADDAPTGKNREWGEWRTVVNQQYVPLNQDGLKAVQFRWPMYKMQADISGGYRTVTMSESTNRENFLPIAVDGEIVRYRFKLRVMDKFGRVNIYPYRTDNKAGPGGTARDIADHPNRYIEVRVDASDNPIPSISEIPRFYNRQGNFTAKVKISAIADIGMILAGISPSSFFDWKEDNITELDPGILAYYDAGGTGGIAVDPFDANSYIITIPAAKMPNDNNEYMLHIRATDQTGKHGRTYMNFIMDQAPPTLEYIAPVGMAPGLAQDNFPVVTSTVTFRGIAEDNQRVVKLYYALGKTEAAHVSYTGSDHDLTIADGWIDTKVDDIFGSKPEYHYPSRPGGGSYFPAVWSGSLTSWSWKFSDISDVVRLPSVADPLTGNYYVAPYIASGVPNQWILPIKFKVVDGAGNAHVEQVEVIVDPDADSPKINITSHSSGALVGGEVRITGTAEDNDWIHGAEIKVYKLPDLIDGVESPWEGNPTWFMDSGGANYSKLEYVALSPSPKPSPWNWGSEVSYTSENRSSFVSWFYNLNSDGKLDPDTDLHPGQTKQRVMVELRARDASLSNTAAAKQYGAINRLFIDFSITIPRITGMELIRGRGLSQSVIENPLNPLRESYVHGARVADFVTFVLAIEDDEGITNIRWNEGAGSYTDVLRHSDSEYVINTYANSAGGTKPWVKGLEAGNDKPHGVQKKYEFYIPIDTSKILDGYFAGNAGVYNLNVQVADNNAPIQISNSNYSFQIDNYYPVASYTGDKIIKGTYSISGIAWDRASGISVQGIERVVVYFSKNGALLPLTKGGTVTNVTTQSAAVSRIQQAPAENTTPLLLGIPTVQLLPIFPNVRQSDGSFKTSSSGIVVNTNDTVGGYAQTFRGNPDISWSVQFNSAELDDGLVNVHYVVFDQAGNASHYSESVYVANNRPVITDIQLGTDLNASGTVTDDDPNEWKNYMVIRMEEPLDNLYMDTGFRVQNNRFHLKMTTAGGNGNKNYTISHRTRYAPVTVTAGTIVKGNPYTIVNAGTINWRDYGAFTDPVDYPYTTFIATSNYTGPFDGSSTVYTYSDPIGGAAIGSVSASNVNNATEVSFTSSFSNPAMADGTNKIFLLKVYDTTVSGSGEIDQLADVVPIVVSFENNDGTPPKMYIAGFGEEWLLRSSYPGQPAPPDINNNDDRILENISFANYNRNIVTSGTGSETIREGYVQYTVHSGGNADVSGKVRFTGKAYDNQRITRVTAQISNYNGGQGEGNPFTIAEWNTATGKLESQRTALGTTAATAWSFNLVDYSLTVDHHNVFNWEFEWDSSFVSNMVRNGVTVTFRVFDKTTQGGSQTETPDIPVPPNEYGWRGRITVNVVPYISEVVTRLSSAYLPNPTAFSRSALGWYPAGEDEVIEIKGFNLYRDSGTTTAVVRSERQGGTTAALSLTGAGITTGPSGFTAKTQSKNLVYARVDNDGTDGNTNTIVSGYLEVRINNGVQTIASINNNNDENALYNREPNNLNNNTLDDDRKLNVWRVGAFHTNGTTGTTREFPYINPVLRMDSSSNWYLAYGGASTSTGELWTAKNSNSATAAFTATNRVRHSTVAFDVLGNTYTIGADQTAGVTTYTFANRMNGTWRTTTTSLATAGGDRFRIPRIVTQKAGSQTTLDTNNSVRVLLSYFDTLDSPNNLRLHYGTVTSNSNAVTLNTAQVVAANGETHEGSMYSAVGFLSTGRPVIAWYDRTKMNLVLSYGNGVPGNNGTATVSTTTAQWQGNARIVQTAAGSHVDMVIDQDNNVHLAYYDVFNGGLYYALVPVKDTGDNRVPDVASATIVKVDTYLSAGTRIMLNVRREGTRNVPYISYFHGSFDETRNSIRVAWLADPSKILSIPGVNKGVATYHGTDAADAFTGAWEVMTVPAVNVPTSGELISNGVPASGTISGAATTGLNYNVTKSMFVGYLTSNNYEGAVLKKDLW